MILFKIGQDTSALFLRNIDLLVEKSIKFAARTVRSASFPALRMGRLLSGSGSNHLSQHTHVSAAGHSKRDEQSIEPSRLLTAQLCADRYIF